MGDGPGKRDGQRRRIRLHSVSSGGPSPPVASPSSPSRTTAPGSSLHPLPLPRVPNAQRRGSKASALPRVQHACEPCRRRKAKCDGTRPLCARCEDLAIVCYYAEGKRDRTKRNTQNFASRIALYESLLQDLVPQQTYARQQEIQRVLDEARRYPVESSMSIVGLAGSDEDMDLEGESAGFAAGSPVSQDWFQTEDSRFEESTGFLGKASTVRWIEDVGEKLLSDLSSSISRTYKADQTQSPADFNQLLLQTAKYHVRDLDLSSFGPYGEQASQYSVPPKATADALVQAYFTTLHPLFPIVLGPVFMAQYELFWQSSRPPPGSSLFLTILNLIFALGAVYGHYTHADWGDHLLYFVRSRLLSMEPLPMLHLPTLENIQVAALGGMYLVASHQINRAWHTVGLAIRYAHSRGLHVANDNSGKTEAQRELEARVWYSTCSLERLLGFLTGRTMAIRDKHSNTPFPRSIKDHVAVGQVPGTQLNVPWFATETNMTSFCAGLELDRICSTVLSELYSTNTTLLSWSHVQKLIKQLNDRLGIWRSQLLPMLRIDEGPTPEFTAPPGERMYLALRYFSTSMLIHRPCLFISEGGTGTSSIPSQSSESKRFDHVSAIQCVASARKLMDLLPQDPNPVQLYTVAPWWCVLHYIVQAGAVIMEISLKSSHVSDDILKDAGKMVGWLKAMGTNCLPALRAWVALGRLLELTLSRRGQHIPKHLSLLLPEENLLEMTAGAGDALSNTYLSTSPSFQSIDPPNIHQPGLHQPQRGWNEPQSDSSIAFAEDPNPLFPDFHMPHESQLSSDWSMTDLSSQQMQENFIPDSYYPPESD